MGDYLIAVVLMISPWLFGFTGDDGAMGAAVGCGAGLLLLSLLTDDESGLFPIVPFRVHLFLEIALGALLAASPWLLGFAYAVYWPHLVLGALLAGNAMMTRGPALPRFQPRHGH